MDLRSSNPHNEISLILFTLLVQLSCGAFLALGVLYLWAAGRVGVELAQQLTLPGFLAIVVLMAVALLISLLHLGTPRNAWRALANLRNSRLSREVFFTLLFGLLATAFALILWLRHQPDWSHLLLWLLAVQAGGLALASMIGVYRLRTVPSWNNWLTPASFGISSLLLGILGVGAQLALNPAARGDLLRLPLVVIGGLALGLLAVRAALLVLQARQSREIWLLILQLSLLVFALVLSSLLAYQALVFEFSGSNSTLGVLAWATFLAALAGETVGRWLFYRSFDRLGV